MLFHVLATLLAEVLIHHAVPYVATMPLHVHATRLAELQVFIFGAIQWVATMRLHVLARLLAEVLSHHRVPCMARQAELRIAGSIPSVATIYPVATLLADH